MISSCNGDVAYGRVYGGSGGQPFDDGLGTKPADKINKICIRSGNRVDQVEFITNQYSLKHGGNGGKQNCWDQPASIVAYTVCIGRHKSDRVFFVEFSLANGAKIAGGKRTHNCRYYTIPHGGLVFGMFGRSGKEVDELGLSFDITPNNVEVYSDEAETEL